MAQDNQCKELLSTTRIQTTSRKSAVLGATMCYSAKSAQTAESAPREECHTTTCGSPEQCSPDTLDMLYLHCLPSRQGATPILPLKISEIPVELRKGYPQTEDKDSLPSEQPRKSEAPVDLLKAGPKALDMDAQPLEKTTECQVPVDFSTGDQQSNEQQEAHQEASCTRMPTCLQGSTVRQVSLIAWLFACIIYIYFC